MKLLLAAPVLALVLSGAMHLNKTTIDPVNTPNKSCIKTSILEAHEAPVVATMAMWAERSKLYKGETLSLHFNAPNAPYLGVIDPEGNFFYLVYPTDGSEGKLHPVISSENFAGMKTLNLETATLKADPYTYGVLENKRVFTKSGDYRFILGEDLHTDDETMVTTLVISYRHETRPATGKGDVAFH